jgi:DNA modification methylase
MIHYQDDWLTVYLGDCRTELQTLPAESVHCVVTSPPYWGLRDYGTASWAGGDAECDHRKADQGQKHAGSDGKLGTNNTNWDHRNEPYEGVCGKCGAVREDGQLGLEPTPDAYIEAMVGVFREVKRVLRRDGTCWVNMGDSYATGTATPSKPSADNDVGYWNNADGLGRSRIDGRESGLKPKDLIGMPWRLAFALQADGWYLRSDIIWAKPNPMPESVTDRPTKSHEYLFLLTRSARYYYDADAVREPNRTIGDRREGNGRHQYNGKWNGSTPEQQAFVTIDPAGRNLRSVWTIATQPYPGAHFATFPEALVEPCVKAGTSERGVCPECGAPWDRAVERVIAQSHREPGSTWQSRTDPKFARGGAFTGGESTTTGWHPTCIHHHPPIPATVLDPFAGSGTTARVANRLSRRAILIDLSADYLDQAMLRNAQPPLGLGA